MSDLAWIDAAWKKAIAKVDVTSERIGASFPHRSENGRYQDEDIFWWTNGFWPGILWILYRETGKAKFLELARECEGKLDEALSGYYGLHHDVGFMWLLSAVADYRLTGNPESRRRGMIAASYLASRFNIRGGFIRAWNDDKTGWTIIDSLMNIPILYWASEESGDPRFRFVAEAHADKVLANFVREDGSVHHIVNFDPFTGDFVESYGGQGYCLGSSWTRGQAWAIHGFALSYNHTRSQRYLEAAKRISHYFLASLPEDSVPPAISVARQKASPSRTRRPGPAPLAGCSRSRRA
jgi:unsaturated chondroitin disaccharide hydrolase